MNYAPEDASLPERMDQEAAAWILRTDRGLTAAEQDVFLEWLAADPRHGEHLARHRQHWKQLDQLAQWRPEHGARPNPDLLAPPLRRRLGRFVPAVVVATAMAAAGAIMLHTVSSRPADPVAPLVEAPLQRVLEDGTIVELNRDATLTTRFTTEERRVILERGEAHFAVTKNPARPFVVQVQGVDFRALGTAFNVRVGAAAVEVLVTEGRVQLDTKHESPASAEPASAPPQVLEARQRAVVSLAITPKPPEIATLTTGEIERVLAWQHRLLDFTATPLTEVVAEFNRRNVVQIVIVDPELAALRVSAALRSDNLDGFVRLLETGFGAKAERQGDAEILLRSAR